MRTLRLLVAALLAASAVGFTVAVSVERSHHQHETAAQHTAENGGTTEEPSGAGAEGSADHEAAERAGEGTASAGTEESETLLGVDVESIPVIVLADVTAAALLLAALLLPVGGLLTIAAALIVLFGLGAAGLDIREAVHQHDEAENGLLTAAVVIAVAHLLVAASGAMLFRRVRLNGLRPPVISSP